MFISAAPELRSARGSWRRLGCCDTEAWLTLDGREEEWRRIQKAERAAKIAKKKRRERDGRKFAQLRLLWDMVGGTAVGMGRDLFWLGTAGAVDLDVSGVRGVDFSPGGFVRAVRKNVERAMKRKPELTADATTLPMRRMASALILDELVRGGTGCEVRGSGDCASYSLVEAKGPLSSASVRTSFGVCEPGAPPGCFATKETELSLPASGSTESRVNAAFSRPRALDQLLR